MTWLVVGSGTSGRGAAALLRKQQHEVLLCDDKAIAAPVRQQLEALGVRTYGGAPQPALLKNIDQGVVLSPGVPLTHSYVNAAKLKSLPVISEIDLALQSFKGRLIGITGTNGKSTVSAMTHHLLLKAGVHAGLAGNIGISLCQYFVENPPPDVLVLELSSYQLELSQRIHADVGVLINLTPDHLDRHKSEREYYAAKWRLFTLQQKNQIAIITDEALAICKGLGFPQPPSTLKVVSHDDVQRLVSFSSPEVNSRHNRLNAALATLAVSSLLGKPSEHIAKGILGYQSLPYRYQTIARRGRISVINDSKGTNVAATVTALSSTDGPFILMLGGKGKGESFLPVLDYKAKISEVIAFGSSAPQIYQELHQSLPVSVYPSLREALETRHFDIASLPHTLLFSPACASYDEFANFEERGAFFNRFFPRRSS